MVNRDIYLFLAGTRYDSVEQQTLQHEASSSA